MELEEWFRSFYRALKQQLGSHIIQTESFMSRESGQNFRRFIYVELLLCFWYVIHASLSIFQLLHHSVIALVFSAALIFITREADGTTCGRVGQSVCVCLSVCLCVCVSVLFVL